MTAPWINQLGVYQLPIAAPPGSPPLVASNFTLPNPTLSWADYGMANVAAEWDLAGTEGGSLTDLTGQQTLVPHGTAPTFNTTSLSLIGGGLNGLDSAVLTQLGQTIMCVARYDIAVTSGNLTVLFQGKDISNTYQLGFLDNAATPGTYFAFHPAASIKIAQPTISAGAFFFYGLSYDAAGWTSFVSGATQSSTDVLTVESGQTITFGNSWVNNSTYFTQPPTFMSATIVNQRLSAEEMACVYFQQQVKNLQLYGVTIV